MSHCEVVVDSFLCTCSTSLECDAVMCFGVFFFQAEDGIRDLVRPRGLGDVYKRQVQNVQRGMVPRIMGRSYAIEADLNIPETGAEGVICLLYTSDAADERSSVDLGGRRIIKKNKQGSIDRWCAAHKRTKERRVIISRAGK